ncbi:isoprenoid biosynthesis glyoxalase ElbB [Candidatus Mesenet endosymbiont of Agriotes lineatus]|uniref:isoprenoid biosynthesis glyoxalase ElbB n=1 Tax=Candidatus Mesenet endosymbiont of Agriotes lineatus TaxID=3077948 RepID=UPI0030D09197
MSGKSAAMVLSGCGHVDGTEIREAVLALLALEKHKVKVKFFAPDIEQKEVINHITKDVMAGEKRNVLLEAARIARGDIEDLKNAKVQDFDMLVIPGGYGAAKNLSNFAVSQENVSILPELQNLILEFFKAKKPIGAICISPAVLVAALKGHAHDIEVTIGDDSDGLIEKLGGKHIKCSANQSAADSKHKIFSCPAYMQDGDVYQIYLGIESMVESVLKC